MLSLQSLGGRFLAWKKPPALARRFSGATKTTMETLAI
jgi:hypothetical protein